MRTSLSLISLVALVATTTFAQQGGYWSVRPAPPSWGLPQTPAPAPADLVPPSLAPPSPPEAPPTAQNTAPVGPPPRRAGNLNEAVGCAAALQVATMAAPTWSKERGIADATNLWLQRVFAIGEAEGITGDKVPALVQAEMERQTNDAATDPNILSRRAFDCASKPPV
jgi:hypothetical protein